MKLTAKFWVKFRAGVKDREGFDYRYPFPVLAVERNGISTTLLLADRQGSLTTIPAEDVRLVTKTNKFVGKA